MPSSVIDTIHAMATKQKYPEGITIIHDDDTPIAAPPNDTAANDKSIHSKGVDTGDDENNDDTNYHDSDLYADAVDG